MPIDYGTEFTGRMNAVDFDIDIAAPALSTDFSQVTIPFTGSANPAQTSSVDLTSYQYSMDSGETWSAMTAGTGSDISNLTFEVAGTEHEFIWEAKQDLGTQIYNNNILIRLVGEATFNGDTVSVIGTRYVYFARVVTNEAEEESSPFPEDYSGTPGYLLLEDAPRQTS